MQSFERPPGQQWVAQGKWPTMGERSPRADRAPWQVEVTGAVARPCTFSLSELQGMPRRERTVDVHCVTRWSKPQVRFAGVPLAALLEIAAPHSAARFVSFVARSARGHSTSLPLADAMALDALVALDADGAALASEHGGPVRMVVPDRYFYKSLKWLERVELLEVDRLGYWEATAGYHNAADPRLEQRYMAPGLSKAEARAILAQRDISNRDLRSLDCAGTRLDRPGRPRRSAAQRRFSRLPLVWRVL